MTKQERSRKQVIRSSISDAATRSRRITDVVEHISMSRPNKKAIAIVIDESEEVIALMRDTLRMLP